MRRIITSAVAAVLVSGLALGTAGAASAGITYPAGGKWDSGADAKHVWSSYYHGSRTHKSSVQGEKFHTSGWKSRGVWAHSSSWARLFGNKAYYDVR